jgi:hypothetical protein
LIIPFIVLAFFYNSIAGKVEVMRSLDGSNPVFAPKSLFTVFRVPLIEMICAAAIETNRPKFSNSESNFHFGSFSIWNILLYTVAFKSLFQVFEFLSSSVFSSPAYAGFFFYATLAAVLTGICAVIINGRRIFLDFRRVEWKLSRSKKWVLVILLIAYFALAFLPMFVFKSA